MTEATLSEILRSINIGKQDVLVEEKDYVPFVVNRIYSYFPDTVLYANEMNCFHFLDRRMQYDYLLNIVRRRSRYSAAIKGVAPDGLEEVKKYYGYNTKKALEALEILDKGTIEKIKTMFKGERC